MRRQNVGKCLDAKSAASAMIVTDRGDYGNF